jgi:hypothetical protein
MLYSIALYTDTRCVKALHIAIHRAYTIQLYSYIQRYTLYNLYNTTSLPRGAHTISSFSRARCNFFSIRSR